MERGGSIYIYVYIYICAGSHKFMYICTLARTCRLVFACDVDEQHVSSMYFFFMFDCSSDVKLAGLWGWSWAALGAYVGGLGSLWPLSGPKWAVLGRS